MEIEKPVAAPNRGITKNPNRLACHAPLREIPQNTEERIEVTFLLYYVFYERMVISNNISISNNLRKAPKKYCNEKSGIPARTRDNLVLPQGNTKNLHF